MNKRRLLKLADFLETVPAKKFDLGTWVQSMPTKPEAKVEGSCGFAGCAMGWAIHAKLFRGLTFEQPEWPEETNRGPQYKGHTGFSAVDELFKIDGHASLYLFVEDQYPNFHPTPKQVAKRIRKFVEVGHV